MRLRALALAQGLWQLFAAQEFGKSCRHGGPQVVAIENRARRSGRARIGAAGTGRDEGTGLGLPVALAIAREHGGTLAFVSRPGATTFSLLIPVTP